MVLLRAWRLSLADVKEEVSRVRRKAIYGKELWNFLGFPLVYPELLSFSLSPFSASELEAIMPSLPLVGPGIWNEVKKKITHIFTGRKKYFLEVTDYLPFNVFMSSSPPLLPFQAVSRTYKSENTYLVSTVFISEIFTVEYLPIEMLHTSSLLCPSRTIKNNVYTFNVKLVLLKALGRTEKRTPRWGSVITGSFKTGY